MVKTRSVVVLALVLLLASVAIACGGGDSSDASPTSSPRGSTSTPSSGPSASVEPKSGPPGTEVAVTGSGWPARAEITLIAEVGVGNARPYAAIVADENGSFAVRFRLEKTPTGEDLKVGRYDLIARSSASEVRLPFQVEVRRPVGGGSPGGPGG